MILRKTLILIVDYLVRIFGNSSGWRENRPMTEKVAIAARLGEQDILLPGLLSQALQANDRIKLRFTLLQEAIAARLGEQDILLPGLLSQALQANDRIKLRFTLLQEAIAQARNPRQDPPTFAVERREAGLNDTQFDTTITGARSLTGDQALVPGSRALLSGLHTDLAAMLAPIETADPAAEKSFSSRLAALIKSIPAPDSDTISSGDITPMTSARRETSDSVHLLVMDMHQAINRLVAATAPETIDGAKVHCAEPEDRPRIKAFMSGVNRTKSLAFGHPGLGTTAVRIGTRLTIQNDIGTTDAHVLVVHVERQNVTVTYTDVHRPRAKFFISLFEGQMVDWGPLTERDAKGLGEDELFYTNRLKS
jgi:hypothetical protein